MEYRYESEALQVIHEDMMGMHRLGIINDAEMRKFDKLCLIKTPKTEQPAERKISAPAIA
ncbi:MAG: hypothetical protein LBH20_03650 [Treponema sp.]|jgi:DNA-binding transcriptional regulator YiaG|nr:hypothetical protein [Treponema sp.]